MKEKMKKYLIITAYKGVFDLGIFLIISVIGFFAPALTGKLSPIWENNINIGQVKELSYNLLKALFPF